MSEKMKQPVRGNTNQTLYIVLKAGFLISLIPIIVLAFFNYPAADDLSAGDTAYWAWRDTGSILEVVKAAWENVEYNYENWSGVFASVFWTSLQPGIFGERFYGMTTVITVLLLLLGGFSLGKTLGREYLKADWYTLGCIVLLYLFTTIHLMPNGNEGLFWHAGVANYTWGFAFLLLLLGEILSLQKEQKEAKRMVKLIKACVLAVLVGGGNYITALQGTLWLGMLTVFFCFADGRKASRDRMKIASADGRKASRDRLKTAFADEKKADKDTTKTRIRQSPIKLVLKKNWPVILCTLVVIAAFAASVLAPGNAVRMGMSEGMGPVEAILQSFVYSIRFPVKEWTRWPVIALLLVAIPLMWDIADRMQFGFSCPAAVVALAYCLVSAGFTPSLYAQGSVEAGRLQDTVYFLYILALYASAFYLVGWINRCYRKMQVEKAAVEEKHQTGKSTKETMGRKIGKKLTWILLACFILASGIHLSINRNLYIGTEAAVVLLSGQAKIYRQENEERLQLLKDSTVKDVAVKPFSDPPKLLLFQDISFDSGEWINTVVAEYYGKESVKVE